MISLNIQNETINLLANHVTDAIVFKIKVAKYSQLSCIEISHTVQTFLTIRYVFEEEDTSGKDEVFIKENSIIYTVADRG